MWLSTPTTTSITSTTTTALPLCVMTDCHVHSFITYHYKHTVQHALDFCCCRRCRHCYFIILNDIYMHDVKWNTDEAAVPWLMQLEWKTKKKNKQDEEAGIILLIFFEIDNALFIEGDVAKQLTTASEVLKGISKIVLAVVWYYWRKSTRNNYNYSRFALPFLMMKSEKENIIIIIIAFLSR